MIATGCALAALGALAGIELLDPPAWRAALAALDAGMADAVPWATLGGALAVVEIQEVIARGVFAFLLIATGAAGAGRAAARWTRVGHRDLLARVTALLLGWAAFAGLLLGLAALRVGRPAVVAVIAAAVAWRFRGPVTVAGWAALVRRGARGWPGALALAAAATVVVAALAPATGRVALAATLPVAAAGRWGAAGPVEALMGAGLGLTGGAVDAAARLWSVAGWLAAGLALAAAFRPRDGAGRRAAFAIVATSPALAGLALADQSRLFMLAPAVACAGWIGRGRILRGAALAVIASWFGSTGDPGRVDRLDLARLAVTGAAVGALVASRAPGRWLRAAATAVLVAGAFRVATLAAGTGSLLAGCGLEAHSGLVLRVNGPYAEMLARIDRDLPPGGRIWLSGDDRRYPASREIVTDSLAAPHLDYEFARPDRYGPRLRQLNVRRVVHLPGPDRPAVMVNVRAGMTWPEWWVQHARTIGIPDRLDGDRGGYYTYALDGAGGRPVTLPMYPVGVSVAQMEARFALAGPEGHPLSRDDEARLRAAERGGYRSIPLYRALAAGAAGRGNLAEALGWLERLGELAPGSDVAARRTIHLRLAVTARAARNPAEAERHLRSALDLDPADAATWANLAEILIWLGRRDEAMSAMEEAIRLDPDHPGYRGTLGHLRRAT